MVEKFRKIWLENSSVLPNNKYFLEISGPGGYAKKTGVRDFQPQHPTTDYTPIEQEPSGIISFHI